MLDMGAAKRRYFPVKVGGKTLEVEPPRLKTLKRLVEIAEKLPGDVDDVEEEWNAEDELNSLNDLTELIRQILSKNKKKIAITTEFVEEEFDTNDLVVFIEKYIEWMNAVKNDPN